MKDEIVKFETAKLAKEKGFNLNVYNFYGDDGNIRHFKKDHLLNFNGFKSSYNKSSISAPTQSLLQRWLREVHDINVNIRHWIKQPTNEGVLQNCYNYDIWLVDECFDVYLTYEEALEVGLIKALELL